MGKPGKSNVVHVAALTDQEPAVFYPGDGLSEFCFGHGREWLEDAERPNSKSFLTAKEV